MTDYIYLKSGGFIIKVVLAEILYAKAEKKYVRIFTSNETHFIRSSFRFIQQSLHFSQFCRIHKSYIVSLRHIARLDKRTVFIADKKLPIGRNYKEELHKKLLSPEHYTDRTIPSTPPVSPVS